MWPILFTSLVALTVVSERLFFIIRERFKRQPRVVGEILAKVESGDFDGAVQVGARSEDFVAATLVYALENRDKSVSEALLRAANWELKRFNRGLAILDTVITLAPLLGLLGTVTGMIHSFSLLGGGRTRRAAGHHRRHRGSAHRHGVRPRRGHSRPAAFQLPQCPPGRGAP